MMSKISVVMPVTLSYYEGCASNRVEKFIRSVNSFINQTYKNKELIIVSDGCDIAEDIYIDKFSNCSDIVFVKQEKASLISGSTRNRGISLSTGDWICYLDSDDFFGNNHLELIANQITDELDWCSSDDYVVTCYNNSDDYTAYLRGNILQYGRVGTSSIIHKKKLNVSWSDGYGHDWILINYLIQLEGKHAHISANHNVCHIPGHLDF